MLEQPPEKSEMEVAAEIAAAAQHQNVYPPNFALGCLRVIVWCLPIFVVAFITYMTFIALYGTMMSEFTFFIILLFLSFAAVYGIGYFDGMLCRKNFASDSKVRRDNIHFHACIFIMWQLILMPSLLGITIGACVAFL